MHGARRVIIFCLLTAFLPTILLIIPLYLRHNLFADVTYSVAESDILKIEDGISTVFCKEHTLKMNNSFNAYQLEREPALGNVRKHIHLKKSMSLPDDTLEYWGFFLPKGSQMGLTVCSKSAGARILVVKGDKNLDTCGLLEHSKSGKFQSSVKVTNDQDQVWVIFETVAEEMHSNVSDLLSLMDNKKIESIHRNSRSALDDKGSNADFNDAREVENTNGMKAFFFFKDLAKKYMSHSRVNESELRTIEEKLIGHKLRHARQKSKPEKLILLTNQNIEDRIVEDVEQSRQRRNIFSNSLHNLDITKVAHGGNAINFTNDESSASSFETNLFNCYDGRILLHHVVPSSDQCVNTSFLFSKIMTTSHNVTTDGYYYYIFYSDNDDVRNNIHATFDIFKPTYQYSNFTNNCTNKTECTFPLMFLSNQHVIVEVPTKNGIEHEGDDITLLLSVCQPRMSVYIIFPIMVLFLILGCAFL